VVSFIALQLLLSVCVRARVCVITSHSNIFFLRFIVRFIFNYGPLCVKYNDGWTDGWMDFTCAQKLAESNTAWNRN